MCVDVLICVYKCVCTGVYVCRCIDLCAQVCMFVDVLIFALKCVCMCVDVMLILMPHSLQHSNLNENIAGR